MNYLEEIERISKETQLIFFTPLEQKLFTITKKMQEDYSKMIEILKFLRTRDIVQDGYENTCKEIDELFEKLKEQL